MATLKLLSYIGEVPRVLPRLLADNAAQVAENVRLDNGGLEPVRQATLVHSFTGTYDGGIKTIYKQGDDWLAWNTVVDAVPGPVAQDRLYYTGDGFPKMRVNGNVYQLGVPPPTLALTASISGTATDPNSDVIERLYSYTFVTIFGEESEPAPISNTVKWQDGMNITLSGFQNPITGRGITKQRIYRSATGAGGTDLFFIFERDVSATSFPDTAGIDDFGEVLPSLSWNQPPAGLTGLTNLPGGMMAAFVGKDLYFCEPYRPHAWPETYVLTLEYDIVALGAWGTTLFVMTKGQPYIVSGTSPDTMISEKVEKNYPCINARGVVDLGYGIAYPSFDGLVIASSASVDIITNSLLTNIDWQNLGPQTLVASQFNGRYYASYSYARDGLAPVTGTFILDVTGAMPFLIRATRYADAMYYDLPAGALYMVNGLGVYRWDTPGANPEPMSYRSKLFVLPAPGTYGAILIESEELSTQEQQQAAETQKAIADHNAGLYALANLRGSLNEVEGNLWPINGDALGYFAPSRTVQVNLYGDSQLLASITTTNTAVRLPSMPRCRNWEVEVIGTLSVSQISLATSPRELNSI